jgi:hypothetical protein
MSKFKNEGKGKGWETPLIKDNIRRLIEEVKDLDEEEFQMFMDEIGTTEDAIDEVQDRAEELAEAKADDAVADDSVQEKAAEVIDDINSDKENEAAGNPADYKKTNEDEQELKDAVNTDLDTDAAVQEAQEPQPTTELTESAPEQGKSENSNTTPAEEQPRKEPAQEQTPEQGGATAEDERIALLLARVEKLELHNAELAQKLAQKEAVPAYGGISRQSTLTDGDIGSTQEGRPRTIEEWRRRHSNLDNK